MSEPQNRHDPWGDLIRAKEQPWLPRPGLDRGTFRVTAVVRGSQSWASAEKYGISPEILAADNPVGMEWAYTRLEEINKADANGREALLILGSGSESLYTISAGNYISILKAAAHMHVEIGEPQAAAQYFNVANRMEYGKNVRTEAATAFWVTQFKSALGSGETEFALAATVLLNDAAQLNSPSTIEERQQITEYVNARLQPGVQSDLRFASAGLLQPEALRRLIAALEYGHPQQARRSELGRELQYQALQKLSPDNQMLHYVKQISAAVSDAQSGNLPLKYRDLETWQADLTNDLEELVNTAVVKVEKIPGGARQVFEWKTPTRNVPFEPVRHAIQNVRRFNAPMEATGAVPLSYVGGLSKLVAAADAQDIDWDERKRLLNEAAEHFADPWTTIIGGDRPKQTWGETFGKEGQSIKMIGEWHEKAGTRLLEAAEASEGLSKYNRQNRIREAQAIQAYGRWIQKHGHEIGSWAETGVFMAATLPFGAPGAAAKFGPTSRGVATASALYPLAVSTPESAWPMLAIMGGRGALGRARFPKSVPGVGGIGIPRILDPHTGALELPRAAFMIPGVSQASRGLERLHPIPQGGVDFWAMHKMGTAQYDQTPAEETEIPVTYQPPR